MESAISLDEMLENMNVLVNQVYETLYPDSPSNPKFSIYRLMIIIWNREVLAPLTDLKSESNLVNKILCIYQSSLVNDINNAYGEDIRINRSKSSDSDLCHRKSEVIYCDMKSDNCEFQISDFLNVGLGNTLSVNPPEFGRQTSIMQDIYTFDFQSKYFLDR